MADVVDAELGFEALFSESEGVGHDAGVVDEDIDLTIAAKESCYVVCGGADGIEVVERNGDEAGFGCRSDGCNLVDDWLDFAG